MPRCFISIAARLASRFGLIRRSGSWAFSDPCVTRSMRGIMSESTNLSTSVSFGSEPNTWRQAFSLPCSVSSTTPIQNGPSKNTVNFTFHSPFVIKSEGHPKGGRLLIPNIFMPERSDYQPKTVFLHSYLSITQMNGVPKIKMSLKKAGRNEI